MALSHLTNGRWQDRGARWGLGIAGSVACGRERGLYRPTVWPCAWGDTCTLSPRVLLQGVEVLARPCRRGGKGGRGTGDFHSVCGELHPGGGRWAAVPTSQTLTPQGRSQKNKASPGLPSTQAREIKLGCSLWACRSALRGTGAPSEQAAEKTKGPVTAATRSGATCKREVETGSQLGCPTRHSARSHGIASTLALGPADVWGGRSGSSRGGWKWAGEEEMDPHGSVRD